MQTLYYIKAFFIVLGQMLFTEPTFTWSVLAICQTLLTAGLGVYFIFKLNPIFEPVMKSQLEIVNAMPNLSTRYLRSGIYAFVVMFPNFYMKHYPILGTFDWQSQITPKLRNRCQLFFVNAVILFTLQPIVFFIILPNMK